MFTEDLVHQAQKYITYVSKDYAKSVAIDNVDYVNGECTITPTAPFVIKTGLDKQVYVTLHGIPRKVMILKVERLNKTEAKVLCNTLHDITIRSTPTFIYLHKLGLDDELEGLYKVTKDYNDGGYTIAIEIPKEKRDIWPELIENDDSYFYYWKNFIINGLTKVNVIGEEITDPDEIISNDPRNTDVMWLKAEQLKFQSSDTSLNFYYDQSENPDMPMLINYDIRFYPCDSIEDADAQYCRLLRVADFRDDSAVCVEPGDLDSLTAYVQISDAITNNSTTDSSMGFFERNFRIYVYGNIDKKDKYMINDKYNFIVNQMNRVFADKRIYFNDEKHKSVVKSATATNYMKFLRGQEILRTNTKFCYAMDFRTSIKTNYDDYNLPYDDVRLNAWFMRMNNADMNDLPGTKMEYPELFNYT
jgi:hypothetical protein